MKMCLIWAFFTMKLRQPIQVIPYLGVLVHQRSKFLFRMYFIELFKHKLEKILLLLQMMLQIILIQTLITKYFMKKT